MFTYFQQHMTFFWHVKTQTKAISDKSRVQQLLIKLMKEQGIGTFAAFTSCHGQTFPFGKCCLTSCKRTPLVLWEEDKRTFRWCFESLNLLRVHLWKVLTVRTFYLTSVYSFKSRMTIHSWYDFTNYVIFTFVLL